MSQQGVPQPLESARTWAEVTALEPAGDGAFTVDLAPELAVMGTKPNGGYMLALLGDAALRAAREAGAPQAHVVAAAAKYLASPDVGPARIETEVLRTGRTASQVRARVVQGDAVAVDTMLTLGNLQEGSAAFWGATAPPELPPLEACEVPPLVLGASDTTIAYDPATAIRLRDDGPWALGGGEYRAWFRTADDVVPTTMLLYVADALPPATFGVVQSGWVPTLDLSVYVRAVPVPGPLRMRFRAQLIQDGFVDEVFEAWDAAGRLVVQSTQLAALRHPDPEAPSA